MAYVATLIANPATPVLDGALLAAAADALPHPAAPLWLAPGIAADLAFARPDAKLDVIAERLRAALGAAAVDVCVQLAAQRKKRLFVADMDSTMIGQECIDELADLVGCKDHVAAITERAMRGEMAFEPALRERVALLRGLPAEVVTQVIQERITLTPGGPALVRTMRSHGAYTCLVSGGFTAFTDHIAAMVGFDEAHANHLDVADGKLTGTVAEPIVGREAKLAALVELRTRFGLDPAATLAVGDGANDLDMLLEAGLGVAFHAKPQVAASAHVRLDHGDLTALLYIQGYRREEFVEG
ncbi:phosphoserine phosphatase SerB [Blastochloris viridis]|uniref:Phosphoserine phosphatase n=1 Tax=Blastochloris viridis TaxID=1079 RepID=A0A0H5BAP1_BLAVI|nr:phosphoserine phosphatase SerB [Blastochloris viridis]ALK10778.1 Phosphoserine phosphatase [Blastochloris viridis]BAR99255.1 phosphoserine phosphatase [Blastochloris viridis]CUU43440.1 Phosphoserine phosphatase [Blastochloris viridis]